MKKYNVFFLFVIFASINVYSQQYEIKGRVVGDLSNEPIEFANAIIIKNDSISISGTITDASGNFNLYAKKGNYTLKLEQFGEILFTKKISLTKDINIGNILVKEDIFLDEIILTAKKKIIKQVGDKLQFDVANSPFSKGNSASELLSKIPKVISDGSSGFKIKNKSALVLINGRKMNLSTNELQAYLSTINSEDIKRIEVQETANASQEGSTKNGIINIVLKSNPKGFRLISKQYIKYYTKENQRYSSNWNTQYGSDKFFLYANLNWDKEKSSGYAFTDFHHNDGTQQFSEGDYTNNQKYINTQIGGAYYMNPKNEIGIAFTYNKWNNNYDEPGKFRVTYSNQMSVNSYGLSLTKMIIKNKYVQFNYNLKLDDKGSNLRILSDIGENYFDNDIDVATRYPQNTTKDNHIRIDGLSISKYASSQLDYHQIFKNDWKLSTGIKFNTIYRENNQKNYLNKNNNWIPKTNKNQDFTNKEKIYASYISGSKQWDNHFFKLGLRMEYTDMIGHNNITVKSIKKDYIDWFPTIFYKYNFNTNFSANLNYRRSINRPRFTDLTPYTFKTNDFQYEEGNPKLKPYYTNTYKLGLDYKKNSLTFSYQKTTDYIREIYETNTNKINIVKPINSGIENLWAADYSFSESFKKWFYLNLSAGVSYGTYDLVEGHFEGVSGYENIYARFTLPNNWVIGINNKLESNQVTFNNRYKYNTSISLSIKKSFWDNSLMVFFRVSDIFNSERTDVMSYYPDFHYQFYMKPITRNFTFLIQYTFDNKNKIKRETIESSDENRRRL